MKIPLKALLAGLLGLGALAATAQPAPPAQGELTRLDKAAGRVTLKHGGVANLGMPPMTMVFRVANPKLLDGVAVGDRVRFTAERVDGNYTVTTLNKQP